MHEPSCAEGVPHRAGYFRGVPVVVDLEEPSESPMLKSNPLLEPNQWHVTPAALAKLKELGELKSEP